MGRTPTRHSSKTLRERIRQEVPSLRNFYYLIKAFTNLSKPESHECNICGYHGRFWPYGDPPRRGAVCAVCGSKERHRLLAQWLSANLDAVKGARILHFAPEPVLTKLFRNLSSSYQSADLNPSVADTVLNIEAIDLSDESVEFVVCSHVLEHVDDAKALREIRRVLKPKGRVLLMFPFVEGWEHTYEDPSHTSHADRTRYFGQFDHVRMFGRDVRDRIRNAGFELTEFTAEEPFVARYGLERGDKVFIGTKV